MTVQPLVLLLVAVALLIVALGVIALAETRRRVRRRNEAVAPRDRTTLTCLRSVLMKPEHESRVAELHAQVRALARAAPAAR